LPFTADSTIAPAKTKMALEHCPYATLTYFTAVFALHRAPHHTISHAGLVSSGTLTFGQLSTHRGDESLPAGIPLAVFPDFCLIGLLIPSCEPSLL
jgi:hypothetical protein